MIDDATPNPTPDFLEFALAIAHGATDLVRVEIEPLERSERRAIGDLVNAARLLTGEDVSRPQALRLAVEAMRAAGLAAAQRRLDETQAELDAARSGPAKAGVA